MEDLERIQRKLIKRNGLEQGKPKKKKIDRIVRGVLIYWIVFVMLCFVTFWIKGDEPVTLITYGLGGSAVELVITAIIEICRDKYKKENE